AGMFLWCRLPDRIDSADVARAALEKRIVLAPGNSFSLSQSSTNFMCFSRAETSLIARERRCLSVSMCLR
ncbi:hypothetical protein AB9F45_37455, partial [Rhizobium leguminosarum]